MWSVILATLRLAVTPLNIAQAMIRDLDADNEGVDDKLADGLQVAINTILGAVGTDDTVSGQARGLDAISNFCRGVLARLEQILIDVQTDEAAAAPDNPLKAEARALVDSLSDESKVYQAKRGADAQVLSDAKSAAAEKLTAILAS